MADVIEEETPVVVDEPTPEGTPLTPTEPVDGGSGITVESLHAMIVEMQGTIANLQAVADQATPVEPAAEEEEEEPADDSTLLEDDAEEVPASEEDLEEVDALLQAT